MNLFLQKSSILKSEDVCKITSQPGYINISRMDRKFETENRITSDLGAHSIEKYILKYPMSLMGSERRSKLLAPGVQNLCKDVQTFETRDIEINATLFEKYNNGEVILTGSGKSSRSCFEVNILIL